MEKVQITAFCIQEFIISGLYVFYARKILKTSAIFQKSKSVQVMRHLIIINVVIILMDLALLGIEFAGHYEIETTYKSALYSIKLKLEFVILNQLIMLTPRNLDSTNTGNSVYSHSHSRAERGVHFPTSSQDNEPSRTYTASASMGQPSKLQDEHYEGYKMKAMDIEVSVSELSGRIVDAPLRFGPINGGGGTIDKGRRALSVPSPAESEVEFANAGS